MLTIRYRSRTAFIHGTIRLPPKRSKINLDKASLVFRHFRAAKRLAKFATYHRSIGAVDTAFWWQTRAHAAFTTAHYLQRKA